MARAGVVLCDYVDDYPIVEPARTVQSGIDTFIGIAGLLGWLVKAPELIRPCADMPALGVVF
eukprot:3868545-Heterocapsa_arctica.AAC.1